MAYGTIAADVITGTNGNSFSPESSVFRNRIINGAMVIDQRNAGASVTPTSSSYTLDRWQATIAASSKISVQQSSTAPAGFKNSLLVTSLAATTVGSSDFYLIQQKIEGFNMADFDWGTANAKTVTLSFWVRSSLTGTFGGSFGNNAFDRTYPFTYTISAANTWEYKTVTVTGDTTGTWLSTNGTGIQLTFGLGSGSTYSGTAGAWAGAGYQTATGATQVVATNGATFYITGVQLEVGSQATSFDYRQYGTELALCQRYFETSFDTGTAPTSGVSFTNSAAHNFTAYGSSNCRSGNIPFAVVKRTSPTMTFYRTDLSGSNNNSWQWFNGSVWTNTSTATVKVNSTCQSFSAEVTSSSMTSSYSYIGAGNWTASSEL